MTTFTYAVTVEAETQAQADQVMIERIGCDEPIHVDTDGNEYPDRYGFDYTIEWS